MYVYIDNNILIDYENGKIELPSNHEIKYVYSYVHLQELQELKDRLEAKKEKRLQIIDALTLGRCVSHDINGQLNLQAASSSDIFANLENPFTKMCSQIIHEATAHWKVDEDPTFFMRKLGIEKKVINNYTPDMLVEQHGSMIYNYIIQTCSSRHSRQEEFQSLFNILDFLGFWQDKVNSGSSMNRLYDANHAYFATLCDYFVTNDKNARNKANVAYQIFRYRTKAVCVEDFTIL